MIANYPRREPGSADAFIDEFPAQFGNHVEFPLRRYVRGELTREQVKEQLLSEIETALNTIDAKKGANK